MNGIRSALPLAAGGTSGLTLGQSAGNIVNHLAGIPAEIAPDVKIWVAALVVPGVALAAHWVMNLDLNRDGKPDLAVAAAPPDPAAS